MKCDTETAEQEFRELAKETGLVTEERSRESLHFIHLTFCEFLAAFEAIQGHKDGWNTLVRSHAEMQNEENPQSRSRLLEVIPFAAGLLPRVRRPDAMTEVCRNGNFRLIARCFLETKAYEHESWPGFVERTKTALLETPEERWNDEWLRDLHLFNVVVRDQQQCAAYSAGDVGLIDLGEFYARLVAKQQNSLTSLLSAYASQDAAAAFRLAEVCHLDILRDCPTVIVNNLDQNPFFELVVHSALQDNERLPKWCIVVSEAALRSSPVALKLCELPPNSALDSFVSSVPRRRRWMGGELDSLYGQMVTVALSEQDSASTNVAVSILRCVRPCGRELYWSTVVLRQGMFFAFYVTSCLFASPIPIFRQLPRSVSLSCSLVAMVGAAYSFVLRKGKPRFYRAVLNLRTAPARVPEGFFWYMFLSVARGRMPKADRDVLDKLASLRGVRNSKQ